MEHAAPLPFLRETLLFLVLAGVLIPLLQRFRVNQVIGFLVAGIVLGPFGTGSLVAAQPWLGWVTFARAEAVQGLAELGVIFLMFLIGLELSTERLWALRRWVFGAGTAQVVLSALAIGLLARAFGNSVAVSAVLGLVLSLSSTAVVMQLLAQSRALGTPVGQASFSILMLQDIAVVPLLIMVDLVGRGSGGIAGKLALTAVSSLLVVAAILLLGRPLIRWSFRNFAKHHQPEVFTALSLLAVLSISGATAAAGLSMSLGAFLAGLLLAETEYRHEVEITIEPFKGLLMGLFFLGVGMGIDPRELLQEPGWIAASVFGLLAIKSVIAAAVLRFSGLGWGAAAEAGMLLGQGGEFAFIVVGAAMAAGILHPGIGQFMLVVVSTSLLVTPMVARAGRRLRGWIEAAGREVDAGVHSAPIPAAAGHVVIIGFGRVGQMLAEVFDEQGIRYLAVENDVDRVGRLRARGRPVYYGNAARPELLRKLKLDQAACLVVTMDSPAAARRVVQTARQAAPQLAIFARSHDEPHAQELHAAGASRVVPEMLEAGLLLTAHALQSTGLDEYTIERVVEQQRGRRLEQAFSARA